ncbi:MAG: DNA methyltransferase [Elainellaceae cyanobacterium]
MTSKLANSNKNWSWPASQSMPPEVARVLRGFQTGGHLSSSDPDLKPYLLLLTGLAIAESYGLLPAGSLARVVEEGDRHPIRAAIIKGCRGINQRYGTVFPARWLRSKFLDSNQASHQDCDQVLLTKVGHRFAICLAQGLEQRTVGAELLGQVYEYLINPLEFAQKGTPRSGTASQRKSSQSSQRKRQGAYYTPVEMVDYVVGQTVGVGLPGHRPHRLHSSPTVPTDLRILDPACGGGIFLLVAYRYLLAWHQHQARRSLAFEERQTLVQTAIAGVDLDPWAVEVTRLSLHLELIRDCQTLSSSALESPSTSLHRAIRQGNALIDDDEFSWQAAFPGAVSSGGFDVVIGNPPYLDSEAMTVWHPQWRHHCTQHYQSARGNWDLFCVFIEKALMLCKPRGLHSFVVPNKLLSARYATAARSLLTQHSQIRSIRDYSLTDLFDAAVYPLVYVVKRRSPANPSHNPVNAAPIRYEQMKKGNLACEILHSRLIPLEQLTASPSAWCVDTNARRADLLQTLGDRFPTLGELAQVTGAATVAEAYQLKPLIHSLDIQECMTSANPQNSGQNGDRHFQVVNSGTIDRYCLRWAEKPMRYLGDRISQPVISSQALHQVLPRRYQQARAAKLIVASMTRQLEVVADLDGCILAGKSTCIIQTDQLPLLYLLGILNSRLMNLLFLQHSQGNRLNGGYLRIGPSPLRQLPIPLLTLAKEKELGDRLMALVTTRQAHGTKTAVDSPSPLAQAQEPLDQAINQVVYQLYRLDDHDVDLIEEVRPD